MIERLTFYERNYGEESQSWRHEDVTTAGGGEASARNPFSRIVYFATAFLLCCVITGCREQILHDLSEADANKVISRLSSSGASAEKMLQSDGRWAIAVSRDKVLSALSFLDSHRVLPTRDGDPKPKSQGGLVPSREEQWFRYERSVAQSIEDSLSTMQGVLEARVHLHLPESDPLFGARRDDRGSGSVLMVVDSRFEAKDEELASLVAGAAGITATNVRVLRSIAPTAHGEKTPQVTALVPRDVSPVAAEETPRVASRELSAPADSTTMSHIEVGLASVAGIGVFALGAFVARRRKPRVTFTLPTTDDSEE
jgi:type III secretion protein J